MVLILGVWVLLEPLEAGHSLGLYETLLNDSDKGIRDDTIKQIIRKSNKFLRHPKEDPSVEDDHGREHLYASEVSEHVLQLITLDHSVEIHGGVGGGLEASRQTKQ